MYNRFDKAKPSSFLYQSEDNAIIIKAESKGMFTTWNIHRFSLCKTSSQRFFEKAFLGDRDSLLESPKKDKNYHWILSVASYEPPSTMS